MTGELFCSRQKTEERTGKVPTPIDLLPLVRPTSSNFQEVPKGHPQLGNVYKHRPAGHSQVPGHGLHKEQRANGLLLKPQPWHKEKWQGVTEVRNRVWPGGPRMNVTSGLAWTEKVQKQWRELELTIGHMGNFPGLSDQVWGENTGNRGRDRKETNPSDWQKCLGKSIGCLVLKQPCENFQIEKKESEEAHQG